MTPAIPYIHAYGKKIHPKFSGPGLSGAPGAELFPACAFEINGDPGSQSGLSGVRSGSVSRIGARYPARKIYRFGKLFSSVHSFKKSITESCFKFILS
jgi:hypothetical protein